MKRLGVVYGLFCARHALALFVRAADESTRDFAFIKKHDRCGGVEVGRWVVES